jgi:hypothetical protein
MDPVRNRDNPFEWDPQRGIPTFQIMTKPLKRNRRANTIRDQRRDIKMAYRCGKTDHEIAKMLDLHVKQVRYALDSEAPTPKKSTGRPPTLNPEQRQ